MTRLGSAKRAFLILFILDIGRILFKCPSFYVTRFYFIHGFLENIIERNVHGIRKCNDDEEKIAEFLLDRM